MDEPIRKQEARWLRDFILLAISRFGIFFAFRQTQPVFPVYLASLRASASLIGLIMSSLTVVSTVSRPFVGMWIDRSGRKRFLYLGIGLFAISSLGYAWAPSIMFLIAFRMLYGLGWAASTTAVSTLAADIAPGHRRGTMIAYAGLASNLGAALGPIAGYAAYERFGFHGMFLTVFGVVLSSLLFAIPIKEPQRLPPHTGPPMGWWELLVVRESLLPAIIMAFIAFSHAGVSIYVPLYMLQQNFGNPAYYFMTEALFVLLSRPIAGPLSDRFSRRAVILPGLTLILFGLTLVSLAPSASILLVAAAVNGLGLGFAHPALMTLSIDWAPAERRGLSMAQFQTFHDLGLALGAIALGGLLDLIHNNFSLMYLVSASVGGVGLIVFTVLEKGPRERGQRSQ